MVWKPRDGWLTFFADLRNRIKDDNVGNGAAALAFYLTLSLFPTLIVLLSVIPYLPIDNVDVAIMDFMRQSLPGDAASLVERVVENVTSQKRGGLLSFGVLATIWSASTGIFAIMQQMNVVYEVKEGRPLLKARGIALLMSFSFGALVISAFALVVVGGILQGWLRDSLGWGDALLVFFAIFRWVVIFALLLTVFSLIYCFGPNKRLPFRWLTPGSFFASVGVVLASLGFSLYVANFADYEATYGSIGAVIVLMFWLYIMGWVSLLGAEINSLSGAYGDKRDEWPKEEKLSA